MILPTILNDQVRHLLGKSSMVPCRLQLLQDHLFEREMVDVVMYVDLESLRLHLCLQQILQPSVLLFQPPILLIDAWLPGLFRKLLTEQHILRW